MHNTRELITGIHWVGGNDRRLALFENMFPIPNGVVYNSYYIADEKTALLDTVDSAITQQFLENIQHVSQGKPLDYLIVNHMEPDHCANIEELARRYPKMKVVGNKKTLQLIQQFYDFDVAANFHEIEEGAELPLGQRTLQFFSAPMVHWPEVMVAYEKSEGILFSADAFGSFGALSGNLFSDEVEYGDIRMEEARRYYTNIVGRYGKQVQGALQKLSTLPIQMICPLHGLIWRKNLNILLEKYQKWSKYEPEHRGVLLIYASMYGNTENAMELLASDLAELGVFDIKLYDVSKTHPSYIIAEAFAYSHIVFGCPTYNGGLYFAMEALLHEMEVLQLQKRKVCLIGNGSWASSAARQMKEHIERMSEMELLGEPVEVLSSVKEEQRGELTQMAQRIMRSLLDL